MRFPFLAVAISARQSEKCFPNLCLADSLFLFFVPTAAVKILLAISHLPVKPH